MDTIIENICDQLHVNENNNNFYPSANSINALSICNENINSSCNTTKITTINLNNNKQYNNAGVFNNRTHLRRTNGFNSNSPLRSCSSDKEGVEENVIENDSDSEPNEIFYDSTNESEYCENEEKIKKQKKEEEEEVDENISSCKEEDCDLSKLYLNDIEINVKEEEKTVTDLLNVVEKDKLILDVEQNKGLRVAFGVIVRLLFPLANGVLQGIKGIRDARFLKVLRSIASSRQALTNLIAFAANTISLNLSSVQVSHRIEPILKLLKIRNCRNGIESLPDSPTESNGGEALTPPSSCNLTAPIFQPFLREPRYSLPNFQSRSRRVSIEECKATKCCTLNILAEPAAGQSIRADIVFIHGLHGSLANTWKQGLWENERRPVLFERPPKPPVRPPKRPRHSRTSAAHLPHHKKMARFACSDISQKLSQEIDSGYEGDENTYSFICGDPKDLQICDDIEYSFPTFRLRMHDNGRLLEAEHDSNIQKSNDQHSNSEPSEKVDNSSRKNLNNKPFKPSPNDPNYSKCWPGDWLPIDCPGVRVMALNYTTDQHLWRPLWKKKEARSNLIQRTREMTEILIRHRVGYGHPIIWVGHSKGGLFIKQIIVDAWESGRPAAAPFWRSSRGVFFYSVPHRGSHLASIKAPLLLRSVELIDIEKNNKYLLDLHRRFVGLYHLGHLKIEVFSFVETALTLMSVLYMRIVGVDSADPGIGDVCGIRLDHREICKPRSRDCILYKQLVNMIKKIC